MTDRPISAPLTYFLSGADPEGCLEGLTPGINDVQLNRVVVSVSTSRSRDGLETYRRLVSVSSRSRPFTSRAQDQF